MGFMHRILIMIPLAFFLVFPVERAGAQDVPLLKVGHVGHDHQLALYVAAQAGKPLEKDYGVYFAELKPQEVYDLYDGGRLVARVHMIRVGGGAKMPAALEQGHIEVGLGGIGPVTKFIDKGAPLKILAPLNSDGDALVVRNAFAAQSWNEFLRAVRNSPQPVRVGYKDPMANAYMIFAGALRYEGIRFGQEPVGADGKPVQVLMMNLQGEENIIGSLDSGIADAVVINEPSPSIIVKKGIGRRVSDLAALPPEGRWSGHPCCVVAASETVIREKPLQLKALLKAIAAGADLMALDRQKAVEAQSVWTKTDPEAGRESVMHVTYVISPDEAWLRAVESWIDSMANGGFFQKNLKNKTRDEVRSSVLDLGPLEKALSELKLHSERKR